MTGVFSHDLESVAEHIAETHPHSGPENRRRDVEEDELPPRDADHARHRWSDGAESGEELRDQQRFAAALDEEVLGPPHARIRFERDATQQTEDTTAPSPSELVPQEIRGKGRRDRGDERHGQRHSSRARERSDAQQDRHGGHGKTDLLRQHEHEEQNVAVLEQDVNGVVQIRSPPLILGLDVSFHLPEQLV